MPQISNTFEFYNPWSTSNSHTTQAIIQMPQMVNGRKPDPILYVNSLRLQAAGYYGLGNRTHNVSYTVEGSFRGTVIIQASDTPNPGENDWVDLPETGHYFTGLETTGGASIGGGSSGAISHPTQTNMFAFTGNYGWVRAKLSISQGTLQAIKLNF